MCIIGFSGLEYRSAKIIEKRISETYEASLTVERRDKKCVVSLGNYNNFCKAKNKLRKYKLGSKISVKFNDDNESCEIDKNPEKTFYAVLIIYSCLMLVLIIWEINRMNEKSEIVERVAIRKNRLNCKDGGNRGNCGNCGNRGNINARYERIIKSIKEHGIETV